MAYQTLLFDLDGTLSDPLVGFARSLNYALDACGLEQQDEVSFARYVGPPLDGTLAQIVGSKDPALISELVAKYREYYLDTGFKECNLYPEVVDLLQGLRASGQRMAVCTSKPEPSARKVLSHFDVLDYFEFVSGGDVGISKWQQIEALLADRSISNDAIMIGDRAVDLIAGHRNDLPSAGVLWGYGSHAELSEHAPAHLLVSPLDCLKLRD
jgi:phosphoglycolate phosphatase